MRMYARKRMLMVALVCLVGCQPMVRAENNGLKAIGVFIALCSLYHIRPLSNMLGHGLVCIGDFIKKMVAMSAAPDSAQLKTAKETFDKRFTKYRSEHNIFLTHAIYNKIPEALRNENVLDEIIGSYDDQVNVKVDTMYTRRYMSFGDTYLSASGGPATVEKKISDMKMNNQELNFYNEATKDVKLTLLTEVIDFIDYTHTELNKHRQEMARTLVNVCSAHAACEYGVRQQVKKKLLNQNPVKILTIFRNAFDVKEKSNSSNQEHYETKTQNLLACIGQGIGK